jgi:hypothetical protein
MSSRSISRHHIKVRSGCYWIIEAVSLLRVIRPDAAIDWATADSVASRILDKDWSGNMSSREVFIDCNEVSSLISRMIDDYTMLKLWDNPSVGMPMKTEGQHYIRELANTAKVMSAASQRTVEG